MEPVIIWNQKWGLDFYIPTYLFFGGIAGGLFLVAVVCDLLGIKYKAALTASRLASYAALAAGAIAGIAVTFHLGKPERGFFFPLYFTNYGSWMVRGGWTVGVAGPVAFVYAALWYFNLLPMVRRVVGIVGFPIMAFLSIYTGLLLSGAMYVPLWSRTYLPTLFLNSGVTTALAATGLMVVLAWRFMKDAEGSRESLVRGFGIALLFVIAFELIELFLFMNALRAGGPVAATGKFVVPNGGPLAYEYVTQGVLAPWFWIGVIGIGLGVPFLITLAELFGRKYVLTLATAKFAMILVGGYILRLVIVWGGDLKAPLAILPGNLPIPPAGG